MSTGAVVIVTAEMESASATPVPTGFGSNGSQVDVAARRRTEEATPSAASPAARRLDPIELPPDRRLSAPVLAGLAVAVGVVAILVGSWAFVSSVRADDDSAAAGPTSAPTGYEEALALLALPNAERLRLRGSVGRIILVVPPTGTPALVLNGLGPAESGWAYQAWVSRPGSLTPRTAALFSGREAVVPLTAPVPPGATVAVTLEPAAGSFAPTRTPKLFVERPALSASAGST